MDLLLFVLHIVHVAEKIKGATLNKCCQNCGMLEEMTAQMPNML